MFNYSTLKVFLDKKTRSLTIALNKPENKNALTHEMLFELETILAWSASKIEINTILLTSTSDIFCTEIDSTELLNMDTEKLLKFFARLQKINLSFLCMPQTIIVDYKKAACGVGIELGMGADLRLAHQDSVFSFNHLEQGLFPSSGALSFLKIFLSTYTAKSLLLSGKIFSSQELCSWGFLTDKYTHETHDFLNQINKQAPVLRIQLKEAFRQSIFAKLESELGNDLNLSRGAIFTEEFKEYLQAKKENITPLFTEAKTLKKIVHIAQRKKENAI